jgi:hypothetical protein
MLHFPDSDTGYYDTEEAVFAHDRELELAAQEREDRFEAQAEEMHERLWEGERDLVEAPRSASSVSFGLELSTGQMLRARFDHRKGGA